MATLAAAYHALLLLAALHWADPAIAASQSSYLRSPDAPSWEAFQTTPVPKGVTFKDGHSILELPLSPADSGPKPAKPTLKPLPTSRPKGPARGPNCKRLLWFMALGQRADRHSIPRQYQAAIIAATMSALQNAPSLYPYLLYDPQPGATDIPPTVQWFASMGGTVVNHTLSFRSSLEQAVKSGAHHKTWLNIQGTFLRIDLPLVLANMSIPADVERDYVLYTDVDVMFEKDIDSCSLPKPRNMLMGPEHHQDKVANAGVLYINMSSLAQHRQDLIAWGHERQWPRGADQTLLLEFFKGDRHGGLERLPNEFNWKGYWGSPSNATNNPVVIIHFHGPKPMKCLECFILHNVQVDYCEGKYQACKAYGHLWRLAPDNGAYMARILQQFYMYLGLATSPIL